MFHKTEEKQESRKPPVHIPLDFDTAVKGLLGVKPKPKTTAKKGGAAKVTKKKGG